MRIYLLCYKFSILSENSTSDKNMAGKEYILRLHQLNENKVMIYQCIHYL